eukprot:TRINITY_DN3253_c1_g3_i1.p1 TRINITY_DN3253_c1_g3~~TRINITY_DN3253_c1_g3_i1.p1  ORF type:complete len:431 (+),score=90.02 TRINITY_DN3253_c1_g3_i1:69-1295(+)
MVFNVVRRIVSKQKVRFQLDGFDLDLAYITPRIIAMGFPSHSSEAIYRNPYNEVKNFFDSYHHDHYLIVNLCIEPNRQYDSELFDGNVENFQFYDHNTPSFEMIVKCCITLYNYLKKDKYNVIALHCKAGKGRTGLMIVCFLIYSGICKNAKEALNFYAIRRTYDYNGVTIPSQRRYCGYFDKYKKLYCPIINTKMIEFESVDSVEQIIDRTLSIDDYERKPALKCLFVDPGVSEINFSHNYTLKGIGLFGNMKYKEDIHYKIECVEYQFLNSKKIHISTYKTLMQSEYVDFSTKYSVLLPNCTLILHDDIRISIFSKEVYLFHFSINLAFLNVENGVAKLVLTKNELDGAIKDRSDSIFSKEFYIVCQFELVDHSLDIFNSVEKESSMASLSSNLDDEIEQCNFEMT